MNLIVHVRILMTIPAEVVLAGYCVLPTKVPPKKLFIALEFEYVTASYIVSLDELTGHVLTVGAEDGICIEHKKTCSLFICTCSSDICR